MRRRDLMLLPLPFLLASKASAGLKPDTRVALIGGEKRGGVWQAGIDIDIGPDWKTYWRMPGDAGIPPDFDWSASRNLKSVEVMFPAPRRYLDAAGESIGYKTAVLFPLRVTPADAAKPVELSLKIFLAVCKEVCIPAQIESRLDLDQPNAGNAGIIAAAEALVPRPGSMIARLLLAEHQDKPDLQVVFTRPPPDDLDIFAEGAEPAFVGRPEKTGGVVRLPVRGVKDYSALRGKTLKLTLTGANIALEQSVTVE